MLHRLYIAIGILVFAAAHHSGAQILISNVFAGSNGTNSTSLAASSVVGAVSNSGVVGPGFNATVALGGGAVYTDTLSINSANNGSLTVAGSGLLGIAGTFDASRTFTGTSLAANTTYTFTLSKQVGVSLSLLSSANFRISQGGVTIADTSTGTGLLGGVGMTVATLFGGSNTAMFTFTTGSSINTSMPLVFDVSGGTAAGLLGSSFTFTGGQLAAVATVPEPSAWAMGAMGLMALAGLRLVRSPRAVRG